MMILMRMISSWPDPDDQTLILALDSEIMPASAYGLTVLGDYKYSVPGGKL